MSFQFSTLQSLFETIYLGLMRQGKPSMLSSGSCQYRGEDGTKCAVGLLMTDEEAATEGVEGANCLSAPVSEVLAKHGIKQRGAGGDYTPEFGLCMRMQRAHDNAGYEVSQLGKSFTESFKASAEAIAGDLGLTVPSFFTKEQQAEAYRKVADWIGANPEKLIQSTLDDREAGCYCTVGAFQPALGLPPPPSYVPGYAGCNSEDYDNGSAPYNQTTNIMLGQPMNSVASDRSYRNQAAERTVLGMQLWEKNDGAEKATLAPTMAAACRAVANYLSPKDTVIIPMTPEEEPKPPTEPMAAPTITSEANAPTAKTKRQRAGKGSKLYWAGVFRKAADVLAMPGVAHVAGILGSIDSDGNGCACAMGAINYAHHGKTGCKFDNTEETFAAPYPSYPVFVSDAVRLELAEGIVNFNDGKFTPSVGVILAEVINWNGEVCRNIGVLTNEQSKEVQRALRNIAFRLEHGGKSRAEYAAAKAAKQDVAIASWNSRKAV